MMSIRPTYAQMIDRGEKTVEVRKSVPHYRKLLTPFKVYLYCSQGRRRFICKIEDGEENYGEIYHGKTVIITEPEGGYGSRVKRGTVFGEFVCDRVELLTNVFKADGIYHLPENGDACLSLDELYRYGRESVLWGWHISEYKYYKTPLMLADFGLTRPPQSWRYVKGKLR